MTLNLPLLYFVWTEEYCQTSPNKNKSPNLWHITSILVCCVVDYIASNTFVALSINFTIFNLALFLYFDDFFSAPKFDRHTGSTEKFVSWHQNYIFAIVELSEAKAKQRITHIRNLPDDEQHLYMDMLACV